MERLDDVELNRWLHEDAPFGDLTTRSLGLGAHAGQLRFHARGVMRVAAVEEAARLFELCGATAQVEVPSGRDAGPGEVLLRARGRVGALIEAWTVAQTAVEAASGVATEAAHILRPLRAAGFGLALACTRQHWPGGRGLAARAVWAGGAVMHRLGLSDSLLVCPGHRRFIDPADLPAALAALRRGQPEKRLVAETGDADEAVALARLGVEVLLLDRATPEALAGLRERLLALDLRPMLAPAGGVTADNALAYARAGADLLVSSAPYAAPPKDVSVVIEPVA